MLSILYYLFSILFFLWLGMAMGSCITLAVYRLGNNLPWIGEYTQCSNCKTRLQLIDFVPIISFFISKGKCRYCGFVYENRYLYFIVEVMATVFSLWTFFLYQYTDALFIAYTAALALIVLVAIEYQYQKLPGKIMAILFSTGLIWQYIHHHDIYDAILSWFFSFMIAVAIRGIYFKLYFKEDRWFDFLQYSKDRFEQPFFYHVILFSILGIWLPMSLILWYTGLVLLFTIILRSLPYLGINYFSKVPLSAVITFFWMYAIYIMPMFE